MKGLRGAVVVEESSRSRQTGRRACRHTCCDVRKRIDRSAAWPLLLQEPNAPQADGWGVCACGGTISLCVCVRVSVPFVFECVGEVYYMVLESSFCDVVLQTGLYSTCTHSSTESNRCMVEGKHCAAMFVRGRHTRCWFMFI